MKPSDFIRAVVAATKEVSGIADVLAYEPTPEGVTVVTAWVELETLLRSEMSIDDKWEAEAGVRITVAVPQDAQTKIEAWDLALAIGFHLRNQRWAGLQTEPAQLIGISQADLGGLEGDLDAVEIDISQQLYFRADALPAGADSVVWAGISPHVGPEHVDEYVKVSE